MNEGVTPNRMLKLEVVLTIVASTIMLTSIAFYNGFPLVAGDTASYLTDAVDLRIRWYPPVFYSIFVLLLHLKFSVWPIVLAQGLIVAHILFITLRVTTQNVRTVSFLAVILLLTIFTSLPWLAGEVMADVFTSVVFLGVFLLGFSLDRLTKLEVVYIFLLTTSAISFHFSHVPLAVGLVIVTVSLQVLLRRYDWFRVKNMALLIGPIILASFALVSANILAHSKVTLSTGTPIFLLARLIEDGTGRMYLDDACPEKKYSLCAYRDELNNSAWHFLWSGDSPMLKVGGALKLRTEASEIVWGTLRAYPLLQLRISLRNFFSQFISFKTGVHLGPRLEGSGTSNAVRKIFGPSVHTRYLASRQNMKKLPIVPARWLHHIAIVISIPIVVFLFATFVRQKEFMFICLFVVILFGLIGNAFLGGALSMVYDRIQSRVIWLVFFYMVTGSLQALRKSFLTG